MKKNINKIFFLSLAFVILTGGGSFLSVDKAHAQITDVIHSASEYDYPPFCTVNKDGQADGFSVELLRETLKAVHLDVDFYIGSWDQVKNDLAEGKIQVLPLVGRTPEREQIFDFTVPYISFHGAIFVRQGDNRIKSEKDLIDKEILVLKGDNAEEYVRRENISSKIITTDTYDEAFQLLAQGKYDAVIAQELVGTQILNKLKINNVVSAEKRLENFKQDFTFAVRDGDRELLAALNEGLALVVADGTFDRLHKKWFGPILEQPQIPIGDIIRYVIIILVPIILFILFVFIIFLRWQVRVKTKKMFEAKTEYEAILASIGDGLIAVDAKGNISVVNAAAEKILGWKIEDIRGKSFNEVMRIEYIKGKIVPTEKRPMSVALKTGKTTTTTTTTTEALFYVRKDGTRFPVAITVTPVIVKGETIGAVDVFRDITEHTKSENALKNAKKKLEEKLDEMQHLNKLMVGREIKMVELKEELNKCKEEHKV